MGGGKTGRMLTQAGSSLPSVSLCLNAGGMGRLDPETETLIPQNGGSFSDVVAFHPTQDPISSADGSIHAMGCGSKNGACTQPVAFAPLQGGRSMPVTLESPTLEAGTGNKTPAVAYGFDTYNQSVSDVSIPVRVGNGKDSLPAVSVAFKESQSGCRLGDVHATLDANKGSRRAEGVLLQTGVAVAFKPSHFPRGKDGAPSECFPPLSADADKGDQDPVIAFTQNQRDEVRQLNVAGALAAQPRIKQETLLAQPAVAFGISNQPTPKIGFDVCPSIDAKSSGGGRLESVATPMFVRRLTPKECERLQGFPDDYTNITYRKKPAADGPRYKALGNSMAVPCMHWLGIRLNRALIRYRTREQ